MLPPLAAGHRLCTGKLRRGKVGHRTVPANHGRRQGPHLPGRADRRARRRHGPVRLLAGPVRPGRGTCRCPGHPADATQIIDVRDLAAWILTAAGTGDHRRAERGGERRAVCGRTWTKPGSSPAVTADVVHGAGGLAGRPGASTTGPGRIAAPLAAAGTRRLLRHAATRPPSRPASRSGPGRRPCGTRWPTSAAAAWTGSERPGSARKPRRRLLAEFQRRVRPEGAAVLPANSGQAPGPTVVGACSTGKLTLRAMKQTLFASACSCSRVRGVRIRHGHLRAGA